MFMAHLPAGYILSKTVSAWSARAAIMLGSVLPDIDLIYFYTFGQRAIVHHRYWTHMPWFWVCLCTSVALILFLMPRTRDLAKLPLFALAGAFLHLLLDSFIGGIYWFWPFSDFTLTLVTVPARYDIWQMNFILHWTFAAEVMICVAALVLLIREFGAAREQTA